MDFLKTLLAYVALTVAFSVQEGPLPQDVPTPTPLPPNVTASPIPNAPAATDVPTATPTASPIPEPTITPNMGYKTVQWQDRGSGVLKVQKKLIELGYLAEGEDDGAYGSKTTAAVRRFQKANGLSVDGIAGQATQTRLFEDPNVVPYSPPTVPPTATPTPAPETPAPSAAPTTSPADDLPLPGASGDFPVDTVTTEAPVYTPEGLTLLPNGSIILGNGGATLTMTVTQDGVGYTRRPSPVGEHGRQSGHVPARAGGLHRRLAAGCQRKRRVGAVRGRLHGRHPRDGQRFVRDGGWQRNCDGIRRRPAGQRRSVHLRHVPAHGAPRDDHLRQ